MVEWINWPDRWFDGSTASTAVGAEISRSTSHGKLVLPLLCRSGVIALACGKTVNRRDNAKYDAEDGLKCSSLNICKVL